MKEEKLAKKRCFVICPIDNPNTPVRHRSDLILDFIITPVIEELGYEATRADAIATPGVITSQIIQRIMYDDLVVADLSGGNPNVYYELAVRHMTKKPIVQLVAEGERLSFDVSVQRTISFNYQDLRSVDECKKRLKEQILNVEKDPTKVDSPISQAVDLNKLMQSGKPEEVRLAQMNEKIESLSNTLNNVISMLSTTTRNVPWQPVISVSPDIAGAPVNYSGTWQKKIDYDPNLFGENSAVNFNKLEVDKAEKKLRYKVIKPNDTNSNIS
ncbi:MAG: hypothetical protein PHR56_01260 [Dehalococcoidales bacterium]|nr:hypothetical protein [Dehalococcoidales bacterium]